MDAPVLSTAPRDGPRARLVAPDTAAAAAAKRVEKRGRYKCQGSAERAAREQPPAAAVAFTKGGEFVPASVVEHAERHEDALRHGGATVPEIPREGLVRFERSATR